MEKLVVTKSVHQDDLNSNKLWFVENMSSWISGEELTTRWGIKLIELFDIIKRGLQPHDQLGTPVSPPDVEEKQKCLMDWEENLKSLKVAKQTFESRRPWSFRSPRIRDEIERKIKGLEKQVRELKEQIPRIDPHSWKDYRLPDTKRGALSVIGKVQHFFFAIAEVENFEKEHGWNSRSRSWSADPRKRTSTAKLRPSQKAREECRRIASEKWRDDKTRTIADMSAEEAIVEASKKKNGKFYLEKTLRNWIKDLCPNRNPGRPKKK